MASAAEEIIGKLMEELRTVAKTETIIGKEFQVGDFTLIPVSRISLGFGGGGGKGSEEKKAGEGSGGGGGVVVTPIAFIAIKGGEITFHGLKAGGTLSALFEQLPELTEKFTKKKPETPDSSSEEKE
jgi:uncharacterized spore protein YtfJ